MQAKAISAKQCASEIVRLVEGGAVGTHWVGTDASMARLAFWLSPRWALVSCIYPQVRILLICWQDMLIESIMPFSREMAKVGEAGKS